MLLHDFSLSDGEHCHVLAGWSIQLTHAITQEKIAGRFTEQADHSATAKSSTWQIFCTCYLETDIESSQRQFLRMQFAKQLSKLIIMWLYKSKAQEASLVLSTSSFWASMLSRKATQAILLVWKHRQALNAVLKHIQDSGQRHYSLIIAYANAPWLIQSSLKSVTSSCLPRIKVVFQDNLPGNFLSL